MTERLTPEDKSKRVLNIEFKYHLPQYKLDTTEEELHEELSNCIKAAGREDQEMVIRQKIKEVIDKHTIMVKDGWIEEINCD